MSDAQDNGLKNLIAGLDDAVRHGDAAAITTRIKDRLSGLCACKQFALPEHYTACCETDYARRLLHRDPALDYTVVVMTWGPGQGTKLHDHAGMWCVECVVEGELKVTQYELEEERNGRCRFSHAQQQTAGIGDAGCLIPPFEYHVLENAHADRKAVTLHVYGGEMNHCNVFEPAEDGWWRRQTRSLDYSG